MMLIGLAGKARSGKDTAAAYLAKDIGLYRHAFADPIKRMLEQVFGNNFVDGDRERIDPISGVSYRKLMQTLGTEWGRAVQPDLWTRVAKAKWEWVKDGMPWETPLGKCSNLQLHNEQMNAGMVLSDVRFDNEAEWIRSEGGIVIHVERPDTDQVGIAGHASEAGLTKIHGDWVLRNDRSLCSLYANLRFLVEMLRDPERSRPLQGGLYIYEE